MAEESPEGGTKEPVSPEMQRARNFGKVFGALLEIHGFSLTKLSEQTGVAKSYLSMIRSATPISSRETPIDPHPRTLIPIGDALGESYTLLMYALGYIPERLIHSKADLGDVRLISSIEEKLGKNIFDFLGRRIRR